MKFQQITEGLGQEADVMEQDHEVQMARADCFHAAKNAIELHRLLKNISERQGLEGWVSEKITLAADYLSTVKEYMEYEVMGKNVNQFDIGPQAEYEELFGKVMYESQKKTEKSITEASAPEQKITTGGLNARARELLIKAYGLFPESENDNSALVNYISYLESRTGRDVNRLDDENDMQDRNIDKLDSENTSEKRQIEKLTQEVIALRDQINLISRGRVPESKSSSKKSISEMTAGATGSASIAATVAAPIMKKSKSSKAKKTVNEIGPAILAPAAGLIARAAPLALRGGPVATAARAASLLPGDSSEDEKESGEEREVSNMPSDYRERMRDIEDKIASAERSYKKSR